MKYRIWDKASDIYTLGTIAELGGKRATAQEYISKVAPWAANPDVKVIVADGPINGLVFMEFEAAKQHYKSLGAYITGDMTDVEVLAAIEAFEDTPPESAPSYEERIAAALELQNLINM